MLEQVLAQSLLRHSDDVAEGVEERCEEDLLVLSLLFLVLHIQEVEAVLAVIEIGLPNFLPDGRDLIDDGEELQELDHHLGVVDVHLQLLFGETALDEGLEHQGFLL